MARIYRFTCPNSGAERFAAFTDKQLDDIDGSPYVANPTLLLEDGKLTPEGRRLIQGAEKQEPAGP